VPCFLFTVILGVCLSKTPKDAFFIRSELIVVLCGTGTIIAVYGSFIFFPSIAFLRGTLGLALIHGILFSSAWWPYWLYRAEQRAAPPLPPSPETCTLKNTLQLDEILKDEKGFQEFLAYLESEFSAENLLFWNSVEQLRTLNDKEIATFEKVVLIYNNYIIDDAPCQINISHVCRLKIVQDIDHLKERDTSSSFASTLSPPSPSLPPGTFFLPGSIVKETEISEEREEGTLPVHVFDVAQAEIYKLMNTDSYSRFLEASIIATTCLV